MEKKLKQWEIVRIVLGAACILSFALIMLLRYLPIRYDASFAAATDGDFVTAQIQKVVPCSADGQTLYLFWDEDGNVGLLSNTDGNHQDRIDEMLATNGTLRLTIEGKLRFESFDDITASDDEATAALLAIDRTSVRVLQAEKQAAQRDVTIPVYVLVGFMILFLLANEPIRRINHQIEREQSPNAAEPSEQESTMPDAAFHFDDGGDK